MIFDVAVLLTSLAICWLSKWNPKAIVVSLMFFTAFSYTEFMVSYGNTGHYSDWLVLMTVYLVYTPLMIMVLDLKRVPDYIILHSALTIASYDYLMFIEWATYTYGVIDYYYTPFMRIMYVMILLAVSFSTGVHTRLIKYLRAIKRGIKEANNSRRENGRRYRILG